MSKPVIFLLLVASLASTWARRNFFTFVPFSLAITTDGYPALSQGIFNVTFDQFSLAITSNGYSAPSQKQFNDFDRHARSPGRIYTQEEAAMALAQILHESGGLRYKREIRCERTGCPNSYRYPSCDAPGQYYYGRGYIQLTWCYNYRDASNALFGDQRLVRDPDQVARDDRVAWQTAFWFWGSKVHSKVQNGQFGASTRVINSGECGRGLASPAAKRFGIYGNVRSAFGLSGPGDSSGC